MSESNGLLPTVLHQLEWVVQHSPDFIGVWDIEGNAIYGNTVALEMVGVTADEMLRIPLCDYFVPDQREYVRKEVLPRVLKEGRWVGELTMQHRKTTEPIPILFNVFRMDDPGTGHPVSFATITRNLTEQKLVEARHRDTQNRMASVLAATEVGTWTYEIGSNRVVADANMSRMYALSPEEARGAGVEVYLSVIHPEDRPKVEAALATALREGSKYVAEYRLMHKDG